MYAQPRPKGDGKTPLKFLCFSFRLEKVIVSITEPLHRNQAFSLHIHSISVLFTNAGLFRLFHYGSRPALVPDFWGRSVWIRVILTGWIDAMEILEALEKQIT